MVNKGGVNFRVAHIEFDDASMLHFYQEHENNGKHYIESVTGDQFVVIIDVTPEFNFEGQQSVEIRCSMDGAEDVAWFLFATEMARLRARHSMRRVNFFDTERVIDDQWMSCALSFGELQIDDSIVQTPHQAFMQSIKLGRIVVTVTRGTTSPWGPEPMFSHDCAKDISFASRAVVEDHHITHMLKTLPLAQRGQPLSQFHFEPSDGSEGFPLAFKILYRSKAALELLHVIPQTEVSAENEQEDSNDTSPDSERASIRPNLDAEADVMVEGGPSSGTRSKMRAKATAAM